MKRTLIALLLLFALALSGCGGNPKYYDTCKEAFFAVYNAASAPDLNFVDVCEIEMSDELTIWATIDPFLYKLVTCEMKEKEDQYRVFDYWYCTIPTNTLPDTIQYDGWHFADLDKDTKLHYQWIATDTLPAERDGRYQYIDITFSNLIKETVRLTLVYQVANIYYTD